ncbi:hypothetical protein B0H11DRAFT_2104923 [Mycena galericulata]|nr:hypothetical protein B0H11DRAFT_2104923 [Mycena galericulata]
MDTIPQELIDTIVHQVSDTETLKACSLVASAFREPSQRILLRIMMLGAHNCETILAVVRESPRVASYIRTLKFILPEEDVSSKVDCLTELLAKFTRVSQLTVSGHDGPWEGVAPGITDAVSKLIREQRLEGLYIMYIRDLPVDLLALIFSTVSTFCLDFGSISSGQTSTPPIAVPIVPTLENLLLFPDYDSNNTVLLTPTFAPCLVNLQKLWVPPNLEYGIALIAAAAPKLEEVCFDCHDLDITNMNAPPLPTFPRLRFVSFFMNSLHCDTPWFVETVCSLLTSPAEEMIITITYSPTAVVTALSAATMNSLNSMFHPKHPTVPRIRWCIDSSHNGHLEDFTAVVKQGIPLANERGKQSVEEQTEAWIWPSGTVILPE